jgi:hypothetical protein
VAGAVRDVDEAGLFDALTAGNMFMSATFPAVHLQANDTIQMTMQVKYA